MGGVEERTEGGDVKEHDRHDLGRFVSSIIAFAVIAVAVPLGLVAITRSRFRSVNPLTGVDPPWHWFGDGPTALGEPVTDDAFIDALIRSSLCVIWVAVTVIVVTTVLEVAHLLRHRGLSTPDIRGLAWAQQIARFIAVGLLVLLPTVTASPSIAASIPAGGTAFASSSVDVRQPFTTTSETTEVSAGAIHASMSGFTRSAHDTAPTVAEHLVQPGESVYSIAERLAAGSGRSTIEVADAILDANLGSSMGPGERFTNPAYIQPGWVLQIPLGFNAVQPPALTNPQSDTVDSVAADLTDSYVVRPGDTLWDVAGEHLGDATEWPSIWERNAGRDMGGGRTFDDPNLILPGWELELTDAATNDAPAVDQMVDQDHATAPAPASSTPSDRITTHTTPAGTGGSPPTIAEPGAETDDSIPIFDMSDPTVESDTLWQPIATPAATSPSENPSTTSTTTPAVGAPNGHASNDPAPSPAPEAPSPIRIEHAALLAAGVLALVAVRRRQRLRAARPRHRVPEPRAEVVETERRLRAVDAGERALRVDVACRAAAWALTATGAQIGWVEVSTDGDVELRLTAPAALPLPWEGSDQTWRLGAEVPIELLSDDARQVAMPCVAFVQIGVTPGGGEVLTDLEACGTLAVEATSKQADEVIAAIAAGLASSLYAEVAHLIGVSLPEAALLGHRNGHIVGSTDAAFDLAASLVGTTVVNERSSFELRSLRTGGEMWEPAVVVLTSADGASDVVQSRSMPAPGHGLGVVVASDIGAIRDVPTRILADSDGWVFEAFGSSIEFTPIGLTSSDLASIDEVLADADRELESMELVAAAEVRWEDTPAVGTGPLAEADDVAIEVDEHSFDRDHHEDRDAVGDAQDTGLDPDEQHATEPFEPMPHEIVVGLLGAVSIVDRDGTAGNFERSKTVELIAWLATHRDRSTRTGARTALWEMDVRDATFANVVSEARRALARLVLPADGEEWVARTLTEQLPIHDAVVTDADLVEERLEHARLQPPAAAIETLRPAVSLVRDMPFAGTSYLWPDAEGITSNLVLLAITAATEFAGHALSLGDTDGVFWATGQALRVLPGHEELIGLRMQAHARAGDLAGVRSEWEAYERVLVADAWSDGEPAPKLLDLRRELLSM